MSREVLEITKMPYLGYVKDGHLKVGSAVTVEFEVDPSFHKSETLVVRFTVNFVCGPFVNGNVLDDKALHFNVRPASREIVLNSYSERQYGSEEKVEYDRDVWKTEAPKSGAVSFIFNDGGIEIMVNHNTVHTFAHRIDVGKIRFIEVKNDEWVPPEDKIVPNPVNIKSIEFKQ